MTDWIIYAVMLLQIPILLIFAASTHGKIMLSVFVNKNPQWLADHPEFDQPKRYYKWMMAGCYTIAVASLAATIQWVWLQPAPQYRVALLILPLAALMVVFHGFAFAAFKNIYKKIPSKGTVKASLGHRKLFSYVPAPLVWLGFTLNAVVLGIYVWAMFNEVVTTRIALSRIGGLSVLLLICLFMFKMELQRKTNLMEEIFGSNARKLGLYSIVGAVYLGVAVGVLRIAGDIYQLKPLTEIQVFALFSFGLQVYMVIFGLMPKTRRLIANYDKLFAT
ncbi:MAG: hypothetical protein HRT35_32615 [Algicola sp.]|nr:hypothetical protein [Algicola sp.]